MYREQQERRSRALSKAIRPFERRSLSKQAESDPSRPSPTTSSIGRPTLRLFVRVDRTHPSSGDDAGRLWLRMRDFVSTVEVDPRTPAEHPPATAGLRVAGDRWSALSASPHAVVGSAGRAAEPYPVRASRLVRGSRPRPLGDGSTSRASAGPRRGTTTGTDSRRPQRPILLTARRLFANPMKVLCEKGIDTKEKPVPWVA